MSCSPRQASKLLGLENRGQLHSKLGLAYREILITAGITSNPLILQKDDVPQCNLKVYKILAKQVRHHTLNFTLPAGIRALPRY